MVPTLPTKEVVSFFSKKHPTVPCKFTCSCGHERFQRKSGYTNLMDHIKRAHLDYEKTVLDAKRSAFQMGLFNKAVVLEKTRNVFSWLETFMGGLEPFMFVEKIYIRKNMKMHPICYETLCKYMLRVTDYVEGKVSRTLPEKFALVFDGWSVGSRYMVAVFASYPSKPEKGYDQVLLSFSTFEDEANHTAEEHKKYMDYVLSCYNKTWDNIVAIIGDNCAVNVSLARKLGCPLVGCASYRFNLAIKDKINDNRGFFHKVQSLMKKVKYGLLAARLRKLTPYCAVLMNETRWSYAYFMLKCYVQIRQYMSELDDVEVDSLLPDPADNRKIDELISVMEDLEKIQIDLQREDATLSDVRDNFADVNVLEAYPSMESRLKPDARIVYDPDFEEAIVMIQSGKEAQLTLNQRETVAKLVITPDSSNSEETEKISSLDRARKRRKLRETSSFNMYLDTRFITPTSNVCERMFSLAKYALGDRRNCITTENLEAQMFLHCNMHFWNVVDVNSVM